MNSPAEKHTFKSILSTMNDIRQLTEEMFEQSDSFLARQKTRNNLQHIKEPPTTCHRCGSDHVEYDADTEQDWCHECADFCGSQWEAWDSQEDTAMNERVIK